MRTRPFTEGRLRMHLYHKYHARWFRSIPKNNHSRVIRNSYGSNNTSSKRGPIKSNHEQGSDITFPDGILDEVSGFVEVQFFHDLGTMVIHCESTDG